MSKITTNEFFVRYIKDFDNYNAILDSSCKSWNSVAKNQLKRKVKYLEDVWENESKKTKSFEIGFQNGSKAYFLFIPEDTSIYRIHTEIQESFSSGLKEHDKISFNILGLSENHQEVLVCALSSAIHLYQWEGPKYGKKGKQKSKKTKKEYGFYCSLSAKKIDELIVNGESIAKGTNLTRTLVTTPSNLMDSKNLIEEARKIAKKTHTRFNFIDEQKLKSFKAGCFLSVIQGTKGSDGGIVHISYKTRAKNPKNISLIGKGVVFDTGGYDVKTDSSMEGMHKDMTGAAVSLSLFQALVETKIKANVDLFLAIGENLISEKSYRPNDVVIAMDGTSVEVINTDAEGRMLLADTILYSKAFKPDLIVDFATLTGDAVSAIGTRYSCAFSNDSKIGNDAVLAGTECGERVWNFPLSEDFQETLDSEIADIRQCTTSPNAEHIHAACFLRHFVGKTPWVHIDLSSETCSNGLGLVDTEVTGFGVRWGFEFLNKYIAKKGQ